MGTGTDLARWTLTSLWDALRIAAILGPIAGMILLGLWLALRSGVVRFGSAEGLRRTLENASQAILMVAGCLIGLAVIQHAVGLRVGLGW